MASLKDLKVRINSVKSTQKITKAMKMVAASKLRRAREQAEAARPYAERMERMLVSLAAGMTASDNLPILLSGTGNSDKHLLVVATSNRGLCGGFNGSIIRQVKRDVADLQNQGKEVKLICFGRKGYELLKRDMEELILENLTDTEIKKFAYADADRIAQHVIVRYKDDGFDICSIYYNKFRSAISQEVTCQQLIPLPEKEMEEGDEAGEALPYDYEPEEEAILSELLPRNIGVQIFGALLENAASEQGARMTAMDNATRNAGDMIKNLTLQYNRTRQAAITKELIEIISGAEAL